tara:strand:+ start:475 stop:1074 length:600 start_codon:yes stop_codon:yes gene_type:complete
MHKHKTLYIVGLGNPGKKYLNSRHNIGFIALERFSNNHNSKFVIKNKLKSFQSELKIGETDFKLFMPITYMNSSGDAVKAIFDWYSIEIDQLIIIVDDIDLPLGKIRFRKKGGSGGHNGLKSIINILKTKDFKRIRIGIGSPPNIKEDKQINTVSHVLGNISIDEKLTLEKTYLKLIDSLEKINSCSIDEIISDLNSFR